jgi:hypothetical protein
MNAIQADLTESQQAELKSSSLFNADLAPVSAAQRKWRVGSFAALWISMSACIPTYMLASSLIGGGMNWWQAVLTIFLGNLIVLIPDDPQRARRHEIRHSISPSIAARRSARWAQTSLRCCGRWWRAAGSAFRRGSAATPSTKSSACSGPR